MGLEIINLPGILFWQKRHFPVGSSAKKLRVGPVVHRSPYKCARLRENTRAGFPSIELGKPMDMAVAKTIPEI